MSEANSYNDANSVALLEFSPDDDAGLIATAEAWLSRWKAMQAVFDADQNYALSKSYQERERAALRTISDTKARTIAGMRAKAAVIARLDCDCNMLVSSLCADLAA